ncbi:hypothetical protein PSTG_12282 [Puccinia striiformis f. sp. tritici PST-78]|uniref:Transcription initiation factor IIF subunit alpha n=1 Tax=Puccinia striiformis f. sp. tritici PST-78 TaxID=1165861 RepID=A0A0L0V529_9BASI|nr:hypothetical protein PSTG_12282 [Puccinia striiformis f. sp. tritici PST-78]
MKPTTQNQGAGPMETDPPPSTTTTTEAKYVSYTLLAAHDPKLKYNILKFAPSSNRKVEIDSFVQPIKLNRKDPWAIRKKAEEEKKRAAELSINENSSLKTDEDDTKLNNDDNQMKIDPENIPKPTRDESVIGPAPASQPKKTQPFQKKTKQVFIAADQAARMLKKEEYQSWLLEDGSNNGERWVGRYESAGAGTGASSNSASSSTSNNNDASNYVLFRMDPSGEAFQVIPCHRFYRFTQRPNYDTLGADEAEAAYEKMQKPTTKEDVGRWFMRRRGANPTSNQSSSSTPLTNQNSQNSFKVEQDSKPASFFDQSKVSFGTSNQFRSQVEIPSFINGRRNKFTAVTGSSNARLDDDEDRKPNFGQDGDFDEVDYDEQFDDDEEGAGNLNDEAMEEDELKELAEKMKREMLAAGKAGDDEREKEDVDMVKDDLFGEREDLTKEGKAVKKLLMRKGEDNVYDSDDEVRNPYASEEDESDFEEVVPPPPNGTNPTDAKEPGSRSGTPVPGGSQATTKGTNTKGSSSNLKGDKPQSRPHSRSGTPSLPAHSRANSATQPSSVGPANRSRATSPHISASQPISSSNGPHSRAVSPVFSSLKPSSPNPSSPSTTTTTGKRKQHPNGATASKEKKLNSGPTPINNRTSSNSVNQDQGTGLITQEQVINLFKARSPLTTKELLLHFKLRLKEESNKTLLFAIIRQVANMANGHLVLKDGL